MTDPTKAIKDALEAGPWGGNWVVHPTALHAAVRSEGTADSPPRRICSVGSTNEHPTDRRTARYIAACNPTAIRSLLSRLEEAERDAARYQWLRYCNEKDSGPLFTLGTLSGEMLDAAIDAAMKEQSHG